MFTVVLDDVGVIEDFEKAKSISTKYGERDIVRFKLTDGRLTSFFTTLT